MELPQKIEALLEKRGIHEGEELEEFLSSRPRKTYDPFLLKNMEAGVDLLLTAIEEEKKICIYGDYDCDGITSSVILAEVLRNLTRNRNLSIHLPSRFTEGYGLNKKAIQEIYDRGARVLVTVDTGSVDLEEVTFARSLGMEVLVTDHHNISDKIADCLVINPRQPGDPYPFKGLAGCGVAFKLAQALVRETGLPSAVTTGALDLLAIGTIGDVMPLVDENRTLVKYGLRVLNTRRRRNLDLLVQGSGLTPGAVTAEDVAFRIVPRLNAAGRMDHAKIACAMFLAKDEARAREGVDRLLQLNTDRQELQGRLYRACALAAENEYRGDPFLLIEAPEGGEGVAGIVAGNLKETFYKPVCVISRQKDGTWKGSGRSIDGVDLYALLKESEDMFLTFGGHKSACGFTLRPGLEGVLRDDLNRRAGEIRRRHPDLYVRKIEPDLILDPQDISLDFLDAVDLLEPCGQGNPRPSEAVEGFAEDLRAIGKEGKYLSFTARLRGGQRIRCAVFSRVKEIRKTLDEAAGPVRIIGSLERNEWQGVTRIEMRVAEVQPV